jgi:DNA mismatch repair protein MutS2
MDQSSLDTLELGALLDLLARHVQTPLGRAQILNLRPGADGGALARALELTSECVALFNSGQTLGLAGIEDPHASLARLQVEGTILEAAQVLELQHLASIGMGLREAFKGAGEREKYPRLVGITGRIPDLRKLLADIRGKVMPGGEIDDNASPELRSIRHDIQTSRTRIYRSLEGILRQQSRAIQEEIVTFRNNRFVIPVRTDARVQVPGVVHGLSSSGQTTFVEPLAVIDQNNDLVRLHEQEGIEITRILRAITEAFRIHQEALRALTGTITEIDVCQAKARLAREFDCVRPRISNTRELRLVDGRHILLEHALRRSGGQIVPISFVMDDEHQVMVISGPNAGGKTVVLKTVGLTVLMAQMGLHVPAQEAVLPVFDQVFADIGDQQSIATSLSTFTAHMRNIAAMAENVAPPALLLIDEVGTGTDPEEGAALAVAIVDYFHRRGGTVLASTHYNALKMWTAQTRGVLNASVEFDERTLRPTYRLIVGIAGASAGLEIARRMDVPEAILSHAGSLADPDHTLAGEYLRKLKDLNEEQAALRTALEEERAATAQEYARLEDEFSKREAARRAEFEAALEHAVHEFALQSEQLIRGIKDRVAAEKLRKTAQTRASQLRRTGLETSRMIEAEIGLKAEGGSQTAPGQSGSGRIGESRGGEPVSGDRVWIKPLSQAGTVESIREHTYHVSVGALKFRARREELQLLEPAPAPAPGTARIQPAPELDLNSQFTPEINVIGMSADEAVQRADKFLDESFLADAQNIRIIHGHGKGILRRAVAELLTGHPHVEKFHLAPPNEGGAGATVVELRRQ